MQSGMGNRPLTIPEMIVPRAERLFAERPVVTRFPTGTHRSTWGEVIGRARRLAGALRSLGVRPGDRVATFATSTHRHVEAYFAVTSIGAVLHTINVGLDAEQVAYLVEHADDRLVLCDRGLRESWWCAAELLRHRRLEIVLPDGTADDSDDPGDYERLLAAAEPVVDWPVIDENAPAHLSYTTGTTGRPKGVLFSHRSTVLQSMCSGLANAKSFAATDILLPLVPLSLSQVGLPFAAAMQGCGLVLPGADQSPAAICELIEAERPTVADGFGAALPGLLDHWRRTRTDLSSLREYLCGGSPVPRALSRAFAEEVGVPIVQVFGMTETSGHGCFDRLPQEAGDAPDEDTLRYYLTSQGRPAPMVEMRLVDDAGAELPWDGRAIGELQIRGPWVAAEYYRDGARPDTFDNGWLRTGDAARIDRLGYLRVVDRMKDLVRSGDALISTVELEEQLTGHPGVAEAAVVGMPHPELGERPWATVVSVRDAAPAPTAAELADHLSTRVPGTWLPERIVFAPALPRTSVGKVDKNALRRQFAADPSPAS
ncbi:long-chain-fatty-acid--CoA ligase [Nocardia terpenica]|uniref:Long-chain fatty acid--CoA ligase n=1 Tax=Nocardia terpenica TaxID=455432 RepID=A0A291RGB0_9NOCA|nr:long-chain-fatty-acid--CoA ligase [Nocardia terpenica]ATL66339.1 long-chain fatty acid--CoA ligase [Nocardia terpenica]